MIHLPLLGVLISLFPTGHLEKIHIKTFLSFYGVCVFSFHLLVNFQKSAIKVIWEVTVCWITTLTLASLIILSSSAKGYAHPCGFKPQWFTFTRALSPSHCCLPSICAHVVWSENIWSKFCWIASRDISPLGNPCGLRVTLSWVGVVGGCLGEEPVNMTVKSVFAELTKSSTGASMGDGRHSRVWAKNVDKT